VISGMATTLPDGVKPEAMFTTGLVSLAGALSVVFWYGASVACGMGAELPEGVKPEAISTELVSLAGTFSVVFW
jgi:CRISPR/Cas system-associated protein Csm6